MRTADGREGQPDGARPERREAAPDGPIEGQADLVVMASEVLAEARRRNLSLGTAESCTGGLIAGALTAVPGSSDVMVGGVVSYAFEVKERLLGVSHTWLEEHGAVNAHCALTMARGARAALGCDVAVSATGIAGPGGAEPGKPVGTVWFGCVGPGGYEETARACFSGDRAQVRSQAVREGLDLLRRAIVSF